MMDLGTGGKSDDSATLLDTYNCCFSAFAIAGVWSLMFFVNSLAESYSG